MSFYCLRGLGRDEKLLLSIGRGPIDQGGYLFGAEGTRVKSKESELSVSI